MTFKTGMIHHIEIYVSNLKKSIKFWKVLLESLNYVQFQKWSTGISWKLDNSYIVFVQTTEKYLSNSYNRCNTGLNHLAFHIDSKKFIDEMAEKLQIYGIDLLYNDKFRKSNSEEPYSIFFEDPDRIKVELVYSEQELKQTI